MRAPAPLAPFSVTWVTETPDLIHPRVYAARASKSPRVLPDRGREHQLIEELMAAMSVPESEPVSKPDRTFCPDCHSMQVIEDQFEDDTGDSRVTVEVSWVMHLACGHKLEHVTRTYRSPLQQAGPPRSASLPDPFDERTP